MLSDDPKATQKGLLDSYEKEYGKCPTWNRSKNSTIKAEQVATKKAKPRPVRKTAANPAP
jgi:hypothetical protein